MATAAQWLEGLRLRTLPAALAPVLAGTGVAAFVGEANPLRAALCAVVALALQIGVNFANDYSDGIRGTDAERVGPQRLVGSGAAPARVVKAVAFGWFGFAGLAGLALVALTQQWWLLAVGVACVLAAWFYTGGKRPYGYLGLGEVFVFVFFGLVAVCGTTYVQVGFVPPPALWAAVAVGFLACAVLVANNLRDIPTDAAVGKRTLATRLGDRGTRLFYLSLLVGSILAVGGVAATSSPWALLALVGLPVLTVVGRAVVLGAAGPALIRVLKLTGIAQLLLAAGLATGLVIA